MQDKISLAGDLGSGKSTVAKILTERLGMEYYSTGTICRAVAARHGMTVVEMNQYMETHPELDREIDDGLVALSDDDRALLIDSRMAWHFVRDTFRVYLSTETAVSAARIFAAGRAEEHFASVEETEKKIRERRESEKKRYLQFYGVNNKDLFHYDFVLDTTYTTPEQVAEELIAAFRRYQSDRTYRGAAISPLRLLYPDAIADVDAVEPLAEAIDGGERPVVHVFLRGEDFCVARDSAVAAFAYALTDLPYIPCSLIRETEEGDYVRMGDTL